jgi:hypothetical protein
MKRSGNQARADELGNDPAQVGPRGGGQSGGSQRLSPIADAAAESTEELSDTNQSWESAAVEGSEGAADHPARPAHTHEEYGRPDDAPPKAARQS